MQLTLHWDCLGLCSVKHASRELVEKTFGVEHHVCQWLLNGESACSDLCGVCRTIAFLRHSLSLQSTHPCSKHYKQGGMHLLQRWPETWFAPKWCKVWWIKVHANSGNNRGDGRQCCALGQGVRPLLQEGANSPKKLQMSRVVEQGQLQGQQVRENRALTAPIKLLLHSRHDHACHSNGSIQLRAGCGATPSCSRAW